MKRRVQSDSGNTYAVVSNVTNDSYIGLYLRGINSKSLIGRVEYRKYAFVSCRNAYFGETRSTKQKLVEYALKQGYPIYTFTTELELYEWLCEKETTCNQ